ncbi:MAG TPA: LPS assembly protein LptD [Verrucomicrobiae bacterium]|jgi:LPS-assembly protein
MRRSPAIAAFVFLLALFPSVLPAQEQPAWDVQALNNVIPGLPAGSIMMQGDTVTGTNGVYVKYGNTVLTADMVSLNQQTGNILADGHVRIEEGGQIWTGGHITYNFKTHQMRSEEFRTGKPPVFAQGGQLEGDVSNQTYAARHVFVTTDDVSNPAIRVRASKIKIVPGKYVEMWNAVLFADGVPAFYFPYYKRNLGPHASNLNFLAGDRSSYGPYLLDTYTWWMNDAVDGKIHMDYREKRGVGAGPDVNLHFGQWGDATLKYYYTHDHDPDRSINTNSFQNLGAIPRDRQRLYFAWQATPATNLNLKALVNYQSDPLVLHDFFEDDYTENPQPDTFVEINKYWENWSLDAEAAPQLNNFFDQVEQLPDVKLTGFRQQILNTPVYYESESSVGYYRQFFANTNEALFTNINGTLPGYSAARADTFQQLLLPWTFFNWLNVTPRAGGRFTYYSAETGPGGTNSETYRRVFNAGMDFSFKASRLWTGKTNALLDVDGLRHIFEPSMSYVFVPNPSTPPSQLPQFDSESPSPLLLPVEFPDYNDIDSIDSQNVLRFGLRNTLQTKRDGQLDNLLDWNVMLDWRLKPNSTQQTFNDLYSDLAFRPRTWITLESQVRYDINNGNLNLTYHQLTLAPNERWSWGVGHWYLRNGVFGPGSGGNLINSTIFFRLNENWGLRADHYFNAQNGRLQEQLYSIYRDFRSWTGALTFRAIDDGFGPKDYTVAFSFSIKASPSHHVGDDAVKPYQLVGE